MNVFYSEKASMLLNGIERYIAGEISIEELKALDKAEMLARECSMSSRVRPQIKNYIFENVKALHNDLSELERTIKLLEKHENRERYEAEKEDLMSRAFILGRNEMPPQGMESSGWYLGPSPQLQHLCALFRNKE
ncbi:hypothetical protein ENBRE01_0438 [Enteropsectra breve]|nr:hypothetical protein ENBRE01_0438 [Enteropsectra breve]